jgi:S-formylglutathione hydrolase FrmB
VRSIFPGLFTAWLFTSNFAIAESWDNPPKRPPADVRHGTFHSAALKKNVGYNICLPSAYATSPERRFPVVYYLHGYEGNESSYLEYVRHWRDATGRIGPIILVLVNGGETSFFTDSPDGTVPGETVVVKELIPHIDAKYRTLAAREGRSLHGYSMGGFGALKLGFKHPEMFSSVVSYGATLSDAAEFKKHLGKVFTRQFGGDAQRYAENDPLVLAERNTGKIRDRLGIRIVVGTKDEFLPRHRALHEKLNSLKVPHEYEEIPKAKHDKDDLYRASAARGFEFSFKYFVPR